MIRKYTGDKKSIEARSNDNGRTWSVKLFEGGLYCRRARGLGLGSAQLQAHLIAMRCNLQLLARALAKREQAERAVA